MKKKSILDVLFWLGFFSTLLLVFINSIFFFLGIILVLVTIILNFSTKEFLLRDIYALGYFLGAILTVASIKQLNVTSFTIGLFLMIFSIAVHKFVTHRFEKKGKPHEEHKVHKIVHHRVHHVPVHKEHTLKKKPHVVSILWAIFAVVLLVFSVIKNNNYLLYLGLIVSVLAIIINIIDVKQKPRATVKTEKTENKKPQITKKPIPKEQRISSMKHYVVLKYGKYETDIDKLYRIVEKFKVVKISEIKKVFNITNEKAEEWAKILEEHNLAEFHYPAFGEPELRWKQ